MKKKIFFLVIYILGLFIGGCSGTGLFVPPATETAAPTDATTPTPEDTATPTRKPFSLDQLPGVFLYATSWLNSPNQHISLAAPDWSSTEVLIPHPNGMAEYPVWSPDGRYIAYTYFEMEQGLYNEIRLFDYAASKDRSLTPQHVDGTVKCISWAPDEKNMVFDLLQNGTNDRELYVININTQEMFDLTNSPGTLDQDPAWSPAGDVIAFSSDRDGQFDIWTISPGGNDLHNITSSDAYSYRDIRPIWSPDGSMIAFYRFEYSSAGLWLMNADGSDQQMLLDLGTSDYVETPVWSPNGEWIALIAGGHPVNDVWLVNPNTGEIKQASEDHGRYGYLSWAPDSSAIAYEDEVGMARATVVRLFALEGSHHYSWKLHFTINNLLWSPVETLHSSTATLTPTSTQTPTKNLMAMPTPTEFPISALPGYFAFTDFDCEGFCTSIGVSSVDGSFYETITTHSNAMAMTPSWSPDGRYISYQLFAMGGAGYSEIRVYDFTNGREISITPKLTETNISSLSWSPDSNRLVGILSAHTNDAGNLQIINVSSRRSVMITNDAEGLNQEPAWSPSGDLIAFSSDRESEDFDIWTISPQGSGLINLTDGEDDVWDDRLPSWSPDGQRIAFYRIGEQSSGLWMMAADGSRPHLLFEIDNDAVIEKPVWSPTEEWVAIIFGTESRTQLWLVDTSYDDAIQVNQNSGKFTLVSWSPDSVALVFNEEVSFGSRRLHLAVVGVEWPFSLDSETILMEVIWSPVETLP